MTTTLLGGVLDRRVATSENRPRWLAARREGITATDARRCRKPGTRATLIRDKIQGRDDRELSGRAIRWGRLREPVIADWVERKFPGIEHNAWLIHAEGNVRELATPDGIGLHRGVLVNSEIKTCEFDLAPGTIDINDTLVKLDLRSPYVKKGYHAQVQWALHVTGAEACLFVWEQHDGKWPTPAPVDLEPRYMWVPRDEAFIAELREGVAQALIEMDEAVKSGFAPDLAIDALARELLEARAEEAAAKAKKELVWSLLKHELELKDRALSQRSVHAQVTWAPASVKDETVLDVEAAKVADPDLFAEVAALSKRWNEHAAKFTKTEPKPVKESLTVAAVKEKGNE